MTPAHEEELSALLDGELSTTRAAEVREQIQVDPQLKATFVELSCLDSQFRAAAEASAFTPALDLSVMDPAAAWHPLAAIAAGAALLSMRIIPKVDDAVTLGVGFQAIAGIVMLLTIIGMAHAKPSLSTAATRAFTLT